jgi:hypothetical protein
MTYARDDVVPGGVKTSAWPPEPYKGLNYFSLDDAALFSEREEDIEDCAARLDDLSVRVLLLHGLSGMGKSSFLRAGLIPRLENPPEDGCRFRFLRDGSGEPAIVRSTADPIAGIYQGLAEATKYHDKQLPVASRKKVSEILKAPPNSDRLLAADMLLAALKIWTDELSSILTLVIDQAEQVLTSPQQDSTATNRRSAFFYFLEELCRRRLDLRMIVVFRTEYYGQFNNFFSIPPTTKISSQALPRSGVAQFYLEPISELERITNIILLPTSDKPVDGFKPGSPREKYGFQFAPGVANTIATDVFALSGDSSTLPIVQVVCKTLFERCKKDARTLIELEDYESIGRARGALDYRIDSAILQALRDTARADDAQDTNVEVDRWRQVLCKLVGQQQVGAITSLVLNERKLTNVAIDEHVNTPPKLMFQALSKQSSPILLELGTRSNNDRMYTLRHDCLAGALSRWIDKHGERLKADEENAKRLRRLRSRYRRAIGIGATAVGVAAFMTAAASYYYLLKARQEAVSSLVLAATQDTTHLRDRLLMLVDASKQSEAVPLKYWLRFWLGHRANEADTKLEETLLRAPIFGGSFPATIDPEGKRVAYFLYPNEDGTGTVVTATLPKTPSDQAPPEPSDHPDGVKVSLTGIVDTGAQNLPRPPPVVGFMQIATDGSHPSQQAVVVTPGNLVRPDVGLSTDNSSAAAPPRDTTLDNVAIVPLTSQPGMASLPAEFANNSTFPPLIDVGNNRIRVSRMTFGGGGLPLSLSLMSLALSTHSDGGFLVSSAVAVDSKPKAFDLDWDPSRRAARRIPTLASDCDKFAFLSFPTGSGGATNQPASQLIEPILYVGNFEGHVLPKALRFGLPSGSQQLSSVAIARGCSAALVHLPHAAAVSGPTNELDGGQDKLFVYPLDQTSFDAASGREYDVPSNLKGSAPPFYPLFWPALAGTRVESSGKMRVAWLVDRGLAVVDLTDDSQEKGSASGLLPDDDIFLTGVDFAQSNTRMTISKDGNFLMISQQRTYVSVPEIRIFDLRVSERRGLLSNLGGGVALRKVACTVAGFLSGSNQFTANELKALLRSASAGQPCEAAAKEKRL